MSEDRVATERTPMPFGKHKGTPLGDIPASYLIWLFDEGGPTNRPDIREYIEEREDELRAEAETERRFNRR